MESKGRDLDYVLLNGKNLIGLFCVQFACGDGHDRLVDVGQITGISCTDAFFKMKVDENFWMLYSWDCLLPSVKEDETSIVIHDAVSDIKFIILKKKQ